MDRTAFEAELRDEGYGEVVDRRMAANALNPEHAHEFDARLLVLEGAMTIASEGARAHLPRRRHLFDDRRLPPCRAVRPGRHPLPGRAALSESLASRRSSKAKRAVSAT